MTKKKHFEILSEIAQEDGDIRQSTAFVSADKNSENGYIKMGIEGSVIFDMFMDNNKYIPILILVDRKAYAAKAEEESELEKLREDAMKWRELKNQKP